jgi:transketolase C-terminal domain/subunit
MGFEKGTTGSFQDLRQEYGLDAAGIIRKIREILV